MARNATLPLSPSQQAHVDSVRRELTFHAARRIPVHLTYDKRDGTRSEVAGYVVTVGGKGTTTHAIVETFDRGPRTLTLTGVRAICTLSDDEIPTPEHEHA